MDDDDDDSRSQNNNGKKHNFGINISKGGGIGIGVGIILVGGAFLVNYFFLNKPPKKPTNNNNNNKHLQQDHSEKAIGSGVSREISAHKVFEGGDDDQDITSCSKDSENQAMECNGSVVETDKLVSCIEVNGGLIDHGDQQKDHNDLLNLESIEDLKINKFPEAVDEEISTTTNAEIVQENVCRHSDGSLNIKEETKATFEADQGDEDNINITIQTSEGKGTQDNTSQYDGLIEEGEIRDSNNGLLLTTSDGGVLEENELFKEPKSGQEPETHIFEEKEAEFEVETNAGTEGIEENKAQDSAIYNTAKEVVVDEEETQLDVHTNAVQEATEIVSNIEHTSELVECQVIEEAIEDTNEKEIHHTNAVQEATEIVSNIEHTSELVECLVIDEAIKDKEEKEAQHDVNSGSKIEIQTTHNILPEENDQSISSSSLESSILIELNPTTGLIIDSKDVGIDLHSLDSVTEKDIIYQETDESSQEHLANLITGENIEDGTQTLIADNVDDISEGSLVQAEDQTDKLQDINEKEIHYKEIEDDDAISSENIQTVNIEKGVSNINFFKKYMVKSTQQKNDEKTSLLMRKRGSIVIGTMSALLCYSCLIAVLAMVLYKIQSF